MVWKRTQPGAYTVTIEDGDYKAVNVTLERPTLAHFEASHLADALVQAGQELAHRRGDREKKLGALRKELG
jgi:hypothetical protein